MYACCFDGATLSRLVQAFATPDGDLTAGAQAPFTIGLYDTKCDTFALGVSGDFK